MSPCGPLSPLCLRPPTNSPSSSPHSCHQLLAFQTTRNSQHFVQFVSTQKLRDTEVLVSFDVVSLFTRVPTTHAIQVTRERLLGDLSLPDRTSFTVEDICSLLKLCLEATYLSFRGRIYQQVHGTAMGSPVSVVVANLVMEDIEQKALSTFHTRPRFWR